MATAAQGRTPTHLWIIGILALLWNGYACYDYLMTVTANADYLSKLPPDMVAYMNGLPAWTTAAWALGVWGGLIGSVLLLIRSRYAVWAFAVSLIGAIFGLGYQMFMTTRPAMMTAGAAAAIPWVIILICAFLVWYSWTEERKGVLR